MESEAGTPGAHEEFAQEEKSTTAHASRESEGNRAVRVKWEVVPDNPPEYCETSEFFGRDWESEADTLGAGPICAERVLAAAMAWEPRGKACGGLGGKRHCRQRKKSIWTTKEIAPLPRRTTVQVQGDTSSRSADVEKDLLKELVERLGACGTAQVHSFECCEVHHIV